MFNLTIENIKATAGKFEYKINIILRNMEIDSLTWLIKTIV